MTMIKLSLLVRVLSRRLGFFWGGVASILGVHMMGSGAVPPAGSRGRALVRGSKPHYLSRKKFFKHVPMKNIHLT